MADQIYLSCWLRGFTEHNMLGSFEKLLGKFPFSRLSSRAILQIYAIEFSEAPLYERIFDEGVNVAEVIQLSREFHHADCAYRLETAWDLWTYSADWQLLPVPVAITCFGPLFPSELGEQVLYEFGMDDRFLPRPGRQGGLTAVRSNIRSLLRLVEDVGATVAVDKRTLWSESGANLAEELEAALRGE